MLPNGVTLLVDSCSHFRSFAYTICLLGGSRDETPHSNGLTHLLEHLLFKRSVSKGPEQIAATIDELGGEINAFTDTDALSLHGVVPRARADSLLDFFSELLIEPNFLLRDLELEKDIIRQEILEAGDNPTDLAYQEFNRKFWADSSLGYPTFGTLDNLESFTLDDVKRQFADSLVGSRVLMAVSGDVQLEEMAEYAQRKFGGLPRGAERALHRPATAGGVCVLPKPANQAYLLLGTPWCGMKENDYLSGIVVSSILGDSMSSRLFRILREQYGLVYDISAGVDGYPDAGALVLSGSVERKNLLLALDLIASELESIRDHSVTEDELKRALGMLSAQVEIQTDSIGSRLWRLIETEINVGRYVSNQEVIDQLAAITIDSLGEVISRRLMLDSAMLVLSGDVDGFSAVGRMERLCTAKR